MRGAGDKAFAAGTDISQFKDFSTAEDAFDYRVYWGMRYRTTTGAEVLTGPAIVDAQGVDQWYSIVRASGQTAVMGHPDTLLWPAPPGAPNVPTPAGEFERVLSVWSPYYADEGMLFYGGCNLTQDACDDNLIVLNNKDAWGTHMHSVHYGVSSSASAGAIEVDYMFVTGFGTTTETTELGPALCQ